MKKIIIIGANGLVGSNFIKSNKDKYDIIGLDKHNINLLPEYLNQNFDYLLYLALSRDYKSKIFKKDIMFVNVEMFRNILEQGIDKIKNVIFFSTGSIFKLSKKNITKSSPINYDSTNPYIISKIMAELMVQTFESFYDSINIVRPFYIFGKEQNPQMLIKGLMSKILDNKEITINKNGGLIFNPIHISCVISFLNKIIDINNTGINHYNIAGDQVITLEKIISIISEIMNIPPIIKYNNSDAVYCVAESNYSCSDQIDLKSALEEMVKYELEKK